MEMNVVYRFKNTSELANYLNSKAQDLRVYAANEQLKRVEKKRALGEASGFEAAANIVKHTQFE
jgi:hypothetical protein